MSIGEKFLDAMQLISTESVEKAGYDKTIQAQILSCQDETIGKYRCRYQNAIIYAYSGSTDVTYNRGSYVYILVPGNDMKKEKTILGTTNKLGINYISQVEGDQAYDIIGTNCIKNQDQKKFYLDSNNIDYRYALYNAKETTNSINLDIEGLQKYIKESSSLIVGAIFKTTLDRERQYRGHYGITYNLLFQDNAGDQENQENRTVIRSYTVDEDNMVDNPYKLLYPTRQYQIFNIDGSNFIKVQSIEIFNSDFPGADSEITGELLTKGDIEITALELSGAMRMTEQQISGVSISFYTPQGTFFTSSSTEEKIKTITAQVKVKGKLVSSAQNIPSYWGIENVGITSNSEYYNKYLGRGWRCLNNSNIVNSQMEPIKFRSQVREQIDPNDESNKKYYFQNFQVYVYDTNGQYRLANSDDNVKESNIILYYQKPLIEWVPSGDTYTFKIEDATAKNNKLKVAIVYDNNVITKEINIQNLNQIPTLLIWSSDGDQFYYDIGHPTLTCKIIDADGKEIDINKEGNNYTFYWAYEDNSGIFEQLSETIDQNSEYNDAIAELYQLQKSIYEDGSKFLNHQQERINELNNIINSYDFKQRVERNKVHNVQIRKITSFGTFKCSVYTPNGVYLGTTSITLKNTLKGEGLYSLVINNGAVTFQYNENGIAPDSKSLDVPQQIQGLSFTVYDNLGQPIDSDIIAHAADCSIRWQIPIKDTMLIDKMAGNGENSGKDPTLTYQYYDNIVNLIYGIAQKYDIKKQRNQIKLTVNYKGMTLTAETAFTFVKQGQPGTNGTEYIVKLVPNTTMDNPPLYPMITKAKAENEYILNYGLNKADSEQKIGTNTGYQLFKAQLWHNGELVWEGFSNNDSALDNITKPSLVYWEILKNKYNSSTSDASAFDVTDADNGRIAYLGDHLDSAIETPLANIIKCSITLQDKTYYGTIPITTAWTTNENYRVSLKDFTGFRYVIYTSDGVLPQYDNSHPFEFICMEKIKSVEIDPETGQEIEKQVWEDISTVPGNHKITYTPSVVGNCLSTKENSNLLEILTSKVYRDGCTENQWRARPAARYDGACVNVAICCIYKQNDITVGKINIPIHYLLNKYGMAHINEWDGNSVQVNGDGGFILSPQVGAGKKEDNAFTGVLMGEVITPGKSESDVGLLGYAKGDRTFFLNSGNGSAIFGKANGGQIIIDPNLNPVDDKPRALLYSSSFWTKYDENGLPENYNSNNEKKEGLLIDLSTPEIRFGSGKFKVDSKGQIYAAGGGKIAGWAVGDTTLKSVSNNITLDASGKIYSNSHTDVTMSNPSNGFCLSADGLSIGSKVKITNQGKAYFGNGAVNNSGNHWTIDSNGTNSYIAYGGSAMATINPAQNTNTSLVYIGTDGISLGNKFSVSSGGLLSAYRGTIGGWTIGANSLSASNLWLNSNGTIKTNNYVSGSSGWQISSSGSAEFNNLTANKNGKIGGWTITSAALTNGKTKDSEKFSLNAKGSITAPKWQIDEYGKATFDNSVTVNNFEISGTGTVGSSGSLTNSEKSMGISGKTGSSYVDPTKVKWGDGKNNTLQGHFDDLYAKKATIDDLTSKFITTTELDAALTKSRSITATYLDVEEGIRFDRGATFKGKTINWETISTINDIVGKTVLCG